ncbi:MAG: PAS domain S-box protein, partial [Myxococcales bacterium]|nr:PAS domain S-box protein [Myxococcales bacterium]
MEAQPIATFASPEIAGFEEEGDRVRKLLVARAFVVSVILLVTFAVQASVPADYSGPYREVYGLISLEYALLIAQGLLLQGALERHPVQIAAAQFALDIAFLTALVALTGGTSSIFSFFYVLIVLGAALGLGRPGAYAAAGACSVAYAGLGLTEFFDLGISRYDLVPGYPPPATEMLPISASVLVAANLLVAFLASYLVDMVGQRDSAMRNSSERFRELSALHSRIVQSISSGVITVDAVGRMTSINRAAREITGFTEDDILFRPVELLSPDFYKRICSTDDDPEAQAERWETPFTRRDGETRFLGFATSRLAADGLGEEAADCGHFVIFQDLTKLKELERRSAEDARLRSIGELAAAIAHEIRNPLA